LKLREQRAKIAKGIRSIQTFFLRRDHCRKAHTVIWQQHLVVAPCPAAEPATKPQSAHSTLTAAPCSNTLQTALCSGASNKAPKRKQRQNANMQLFLYLKQEPH
jgi:hypothetical protein